MTDLKFFLSLFTNYLEIDREKNSNDELIDLYIDEENKINMAYIIYKSDPIRLKTSSLRFVSHFVLYCFVSICLFSSGILK